MSIVNATGTVKSFARFFLVSLKYKKAALAYLFRVIGHLPGFSCVFERDITSARRYKKRGRLEKFNIGQATHKKRAQLYFFNFLVTIDFSHH